MQVNAPGGGALRFRSQKETPGVVYCDTEAFSEKGIRAFCPPRAIRKIETNGHASLTRAGRYKQKKKQEKKRTSLSKEHSIQSRSRGVGHVATQPAAATRDYLLLFRTGDTPMAGVGIAGGLRPEQQCRQIRHE